MNHSTSRLYFFLLAVAILAQAGTAPAIASKHALLLSKYTFHESFESVDPFSLWTSNGAYEVHYKGVTTQKASEGNHSLKIDVTLSPGTYVYWRIRLVMMPRKLAGKYYFDKIVGAKGFKEGERSFVRSNETEWECTWKSFS